MEQQKGTPPNPKLAFENPEEFKRQMDIYLAQVSGGIPVSPPPVDGNGELTQAEKAKRIEKLVQELRLFGHVSASPEELEKLGVTYADLTRFMFVFKHLGDDDDEG